MAPEGVIETLQRLRNRFLWGGSDERKVIHWISWDKVTAPKDSGGLGIGMIKALNISLIMKWWWKLRTKPGQLWATVIYSVHNLRSKPDVCYSMKTLPGVWNNIAGIKNDLMKKNIPVCSVLSKRQDPTGEIWKCGLTPDGSYSVCALRKRWDYRPPTIGSNFHWLKEIPLKVSCFIWRAQAGRIPTVTELSKICRIIDLSDVWGYWRMSRPLSCGMLVCSEDQRWGTKLVQGASWKFS